MTLSGCVREVMHWTKAGAGQDAFMQIVTFAFNKHSKANRAVT